MRWNVAKRPWQVKQSWLEVESIHILLDTKFTSPSPPLSISCLLCLFFLIVFWFTLLAGYYGRNGRGMGDRGNYLPSRVRCHSELPPVESVGDQMDAPGQFLVSQSGRQREREGAGEGVERAGAGLSIKCHRCSIALVGFSTATPYGSSWSQAAFFFFLLPSAALVVCFLFAWLLVCFSFCLSLAAPLLYLPPLPSMAGCFVSVWPSGRPIYVHVALHCILQGAAE